MAKKFSGKFWLALVIFSLTGQVAWVVENMYFNVFIYKMFHADPTAISTVVAASATAAAVTTLLIGALSDRVGKRKIFIVAGYILWGISILAFALIRVDVIGALFGNTVSAAALGVNLVILMDCVMTFFGSSANDACFNAWLTESTDEGTRGKAEGINSMMPLVAILVVFGGFMGFDLDKAESWTLIYIIIGAVVLLIGVAGIFLIEDTTVETGVNRNYFANIFYGFRPSVIKGNGVLYMTLIAFMIFGISIQTYMPYLILYYTVSLKMENYVMIMAPAIILASVATFFYGRLYDRFGFVKTVFPAVFILMGGYTLLYLFRDTPMVFLGSLLMMSGYLCGMAVFGAMVRDHTPENKTGMFQGLRIFAQVLIPGITGPYIGAFVLSSAERVVNDDGTESFIPNENIYLAAFMVALLLMIFLYLVFLRRKETAAVKVVNDVQADSMEALLQSGQPAQDVEKMMTSVIDGIVPAAAGKQAAAPEGAGRQDEFWDVLRDAEAAEAAPAPERTAGQVYEDRRDEDAWASGRPGDEASTEPVYYAESEGPED
ncbi:MAG: MFS transporter, partial [Lachnospiraceae bacterium]|nr:MFS transporter [Lachnospiraceae bacterium]